MSETPKTDQFWLAAEFTNENTREKQILAVMGEIERQAQKLMAALTICNRVAVGAKIRAMNGGCIEGAVAALDGIAEISKEAIECQSMKQ